jgi:hypothetical protein
LVSSGAECLWGSCAAVLLSSGKRAGQGVPIVAL